MSQQEPSIALAVWRHPRPVLMLGLIGLLIGAILGAVMGMRAPALAESTFLIRNPSALSITAVLDPGQSSRYVADQVAIIQSPEVISQAAEKVRAATGEVLTIRQFERALSITWSTTSAVAVARFKHASPDVALAATTALLDTYQEVLESEANASGRAAIELTDRAIQDKESEISDLERQLAAALGVETEEEARLRALADEAAVIRSQMVGVSEAALAVLRDRLDAINTEREVLVFLEQSRPPSPEVVHLERRIEQAVLEQNVLIDRRTSLEVEAELNQPPTAVFSPPRIVESSGLPPAITYAVALALLGLFIGAARVYVRELRNETVDDGRDVESMVQAPLLAEVPEFEMEKLRTRLPIWDEPNSRAAESYRFLAAATEIRMNDSGVRKLAVVGANVGGGKTTTAANLGIGLAKQGSRVLLIDADFGNQELSRLFDIDIHKALGITDVLDGSTSVDKAGTQVTAFEGSLVIMGRGLGAAVAPNLFRSSDAEHFFRTIDLYYDIVIIDTPPLLQIAYSSNIAAMAGAALLVVPNRSPVEEVLATASRLRSLGSDILGYAVTKVDAKHRGPAAEGSLRDVLGGGSLAKPPHG